MKKIDESIKFTLEGDNVKAIGYPELEGTKGYLVGEGMAFFVSGGYEMFIANTHTGKIRKLSTKGGGLLVTDSEIDYDAIAKVCRNGRHNARTKSICYAGLNRWDDFKDGLCAISWMLYPDGRYFADSDGFGMEDNDEEVVYGIIDTNLEFVQPFAPVNDVSKMLTNMKKLKPSKLPESGAKRIFNLIIIDESGSMHSIKKEAIDSVNETIQTIRSAQEKYKDHEYYVTVVTFNTTVKHVSDCVPISDIVELTENTYNPSCCTALYDAMGMSLTNLSKKVNDEDNVLVTIVTDGYENASTEYSGKVIKALVDDLKAKKWVFAYIGANQDVEAVAASISITNVLNFETNSLGVQEMSSKLCAARARIFDSMADRSFDPGQANENFFKEY